MWKKVDVPRETSDMEGAIFCGMKERREVSCVKIFF